MVQYTTLDSTLAAIADPTRRRILERLGRGTATIGELAEPFAMTVTGMAKHVRILERARLVETHKIGRTRRCALGPDRLDDVQSWLNQYRTLAEERLDRLGEVLDDLTGGPS